MNICAKQVMAMADYHFDQAKAKMDDAIDREESRDELIANRSQEIEVQRIYEMSAMDVTAGLHSVLEGGAGKVIAERIKAGQMESVGVMVCAVIRSYIRSDAEVIAADWVEKIEREANLFGELN